MPAHAHPIHATPVALHPRRAQIARLRARDFRPHPSIDMLLDPDKPLIALVGPNGAGKTSLLEAIDCLTPAASLRETPFAEAARVGGAGGWEVAARFLTPLGARDITARLEANEEGVHNRRALRLDAAPARPDAFLDAARVVSMTPRSMDLFRHGPSARRRFLDLCAATLDPRHATRVHIWARAVRGRAIALRAPKVDALLVDAQEQAMAATGVAIAASRAALRSRLAQSLAEDRQTPLRPRLALRGAIHDDFAQGLDAAAAEDSLRARLRRHRQEDAIQGGAMAGPHREDLDICLADRAARACSTGERKAMLTALALAFARLVRRASAQAPVVLLDEFAAHLDPCRRKGFLDALRRLGCQTWIATADAEVLADAEDIQTFAVLPGRVEPTS